MSTKVELQQMLELALATPEVGAVNFNILRSFLYEIINHIDVREKLITVTEEGDHKSVYEAIREAGRSPHSQLFEERKSTTSANLENEEPEPDTEVPSSPPREPSALEKPTTPSPPPTPLRSQSASDSIVFEKLSKRISELEARIEDFEKSPPPAAIPSIASLTRKASKTPAHDIVDILSVKGKLEASENTIESLAELVDSLVTDVNVMKQVIPNITNIPNIVDDMEKLNTVLEDLHRSVDDRLKMLETRSVDASDTKPVPELISQLEVKNLVESKIEESIAKIKEDISKELVPPSIEIPSDAPPEVVEALKKLASHEQMHYDLQAEVRRMEEVLSRKADVGATPVDRLPIEMEIPVEIFQDLNMLKGKFDACNKELSGLVTNMRRVEEENKGIETEMKQSQKELTEMRNNFLLLQHEAKEEAKAKEEEEEAGRPVTRTRSHSVSNDDISLIRNMIFDLQEEKEKLKKANHQLTDQLQNKQKHLDDLYQLVEQLNEVKADKDHVISLIDFKSDKRDLETKIGRDDFDQCMGIVDQSLRDVLQKLDGQDDSLKRAIKKVSSDIGQKLDRQEVDTIKEYIDGRVKSMKPKPLEKSPPEEYAAGFRNPCFRDFHCISCDKPVDNVREKPLFPPLPSLQPLPGTKSYRPYTTFEIEQIRQHMFQEGMDVHQERFEMIARERIKLQQELLKLSGARNLQELTEVTDRPCGGTHTQTYPNSRAIVRGLQLNRDDLDFYVPQKDMQVVDIMGQDGHIYKGQVNELPPLSRLPEPPSAIASDGQTHRRSGRIHRSTTPASAEMRKLGDAQMTVEV